MKVENSHLRVNWIDGMKINKDHFIELENAVLQLHKDTSAAAITELNYGLLPMIDNDEAISMKLSLDGQNTVIVQLDRCRAITTGGYLIDLSGEMASYLSKVGHVIKASYSFTQEDNECYVVLGVDPFKRVPVGDSNPQEEPPRHPFVLPEYKIHIVSASEVNQQEFGRHHITIGKVDFIDGTPSLAEDFIPPCVSIQSHQDLKYVFSEIQTFFSSMEKYSLNIVQKIYQKKQSNELAQMVLSICKGMLLYLSSAIPEYRVKDQYAPPVSMIVRLMAFARLIKNEMDIYVGTGKEELLNYLSDWCDVNQGAFESIMVEMIEIEYQHTDINKALNNIAHFTKLMMLLFKKLNELDYIGKRSDSNIFVKEETVAKEEVKSRRSFLLD